MADARGTYLLGLCCNIHESSAALVKDGILIAAAEEERFTRKKHDNRFPIEAIDYCLREAGITMGDVSYAGFYWQPWKGLLKRLWWLVRYFPASLQTFHGGKHWRGSVGTLAGHSRRALQAAPNGISRHVLLRRPSRRTRSQHVSRLAPPVRGRPDGQSVRRRLHDTLSPRHGQPDPAPETLLSSALAGIFYAALTQFLGYRANSDEYKVMGLRVLRPAGIRGDVQQHGSLRAGPAERRQFLVRVSSWKRQLLLAPFHRHVRPAMSR